tara:strand:+ start:28915 stop:29427 length:513 start_codon:yes stop_codon:yes gene_type:complete
MEIKFETVKGTLFGEFLGCAFQDLLRQTLLETPEAAGELNCDMLDIQTTLNGKALDFQRLFSAFEGKLPSSNGEASTEGSGDMILVDRNKLKEALEQVDYAQSECGSVDSRVEESFNDGIAAASSSYYCGEYASEAASEAGYEHSPGGEVTHEIYNHLDSASDILRELTD